MRQGVSAAPWSAVMVLSRTDPPPVLRVLERLRSGRMPESAPVRHTCDVDAGGVCNALSRPRLPAPRFPGHRCRGERRVGVLRPAAPGATSVRMGVGLNYLGCAGGPPPRVPRHRVPSPVSRLASCRVDKHPLRWNTPATSLAGHHWTLLQSHPAARAAPRHGPGTHRHHRPQAG